MKSDVLVRRFGRVEYLPTLERMREFSSQRQADTPDEIWLLEHPSVYTLGLAGDPRHVLAVGDTPIVKTDRGGQVTWHGPGQLVAYVLLDLRRLGLGPRELVRKLEAAVVALLAERDIKGEVRPGAPGVYVAGAKIASLGLRIRNGRSWHGLALNVAPDLSAFSGINPCGYEGLAVTSLAQLGLKATLEQVGDDLAGHLCRAFYGALSPAIIETSHEPSGS